MGGVTSDLPHPVTGQPFPSPVPPGTGWPDDPATAATPVARTADDVRRAAGPADLAELTAAGQRLPRLPAAGRLARGRRPGQARVVRRGALLGPADRRLGVRDARRAGRRARAGRERRQPDRPDLHRGPLRGLAVRRAAPGRPRRAGHLGARRRRPAAARRPDGRRGPLRAAGQQADHHRAGHLRAVAGARGGAGRGTSVRAVVCLGQYGWDAALRTLRSLGYDVPRPKPRFGHAAEARVTAPGRTRASPCSAATTPRSRTPSPAG